MPSICLSPHWSPNFPSPAFHPVIMIFQMLKSTNPDRNDEDYYYLIGMMRIIIIWIKLFIIVVDIFLVESLLTFSQTILENWR